MTDTNVRKTGSRDELDSIWSLLTLIVLTGFYSVIADDPGVGDGTTAGNLRTTAAADYRIGRTGGGSLASTDDLWDLSAETDTAADEYRAYWLYQDGTFDAGADAKSADAALATLPAIDTAKSVIGVYVAGLATDFDDAGGLAAQGTIYDGVPVGVRGARTVDLAPIALVAP